MKKIIGIIIMLFVLIAPLRVSAETIQKVEISVQGEIEKDSEIEININLKDAKNLYCAQMEFLYDSNKIEVISLDRTDYINSGKELKEYYRTPNYSDGRAIYLFSYINDYEGVSGDGTLITIKAKILTDDKFEITKDNLLLGLVQRDNDNNMNIMDLDFNGYGENVEPVIIKSEEISQKLSRIPKETSVEEQQSTENKELEKSNEETEEESISIEEDSVTKDEDSEDGGETSNKGVYILAIGGIVIIIGGIIFYIKKKRISIK